MAAAKREYVAVFSIGARLLGTFRGAMAAANARLRGLQVAAARVGAAMRRMALAFSGLFAGLAAFGAFKLFSKVFKDATAEIEEQHDRERKLQSMLMQNAEIRKKGLGFAKKQKDLVIAHNAALSKQGLASADMFDAMSSNLAVAGLMPKEIMETEGPLADVLIAMKGINASEEDAAQFAFAYGKAVKQGMVKPLAKMGLMLSKDEAKLFPKRSPEERYKILLKLAKLHKGVNKEALGDPGGQVKKLNEDLSEMAERIGGQVLPARDKMAKVWRELIPEIEPYIQGMQEMAVNAQVAIAEYAKNTLVPALKRFSEWAKTDGAKAWEKIKKAWGEMSGKLGKALSDQFKRLGLGGKSWGDIAVDAMEKVAKFFTWIGNNAPMIVHAIEGITIALIALKAASLIQGNIVIIGIALAVAGIAKCIDEYTKFKALVNGELVSDPDHFTKHWYLMNQTWTEVWAGLQGAWEEMKATWERIVNYIKWVWEQFIDKINLFKPPKWWTDFWKDQTDEAKKHYDATQGLRDADNASAAEQARQQQAYYEKYGRGITRSATPVEQAQAIDATKASGASMLARPAYDLRMPALQKSVLPAIAQPIRDQAILPILGIESAVLDTHERFRAMFGDMVDTTAVTNKAMTDELVPAVATVAEQFMFLSETMAGLGLGGGGAGGGGFGGGGGGGYAGAAALAPMGGMTPGVPLSTEALAKVAEERADIIKELQKPELQNLVSATLSTEMQSAEGQKDVLEALVNRSVAYKRAGKYGGVEQMIKGGFYGPYNRGVTNAVMRSGLSPQRQEQVAAMVEEAKTRNVLQGMTDQGVNVGPRRYVHGEGYSYAHGYGEQYKTAAYLESQKATRGYQLGGIAKKPQIATLAEKGPEAVIPLARSGRKSGATHVNFQPNITINGNASAEEQATMDTKLRDLARDFINDFKRAQSQERRLSYEGGYG